MLSRIRSRLTYANVISSIALFLALTGGTAVALSGTNTVFSDDIAPQQVQRGDVKIYGWNEPTPSNDFVNIADGNGRLGFFKDPGGVVHLKGVLRAPNCSADIVADTAILKLPAGFDPVNYVNLIGSDPFSPHKPAYILVAPDGTVLVRQGSPCHVALDGLTFRVDQ